MNNSQNLVGKTVVVAEPKLNDLHNHSFVGTVVKVKPDCVSVEDQDGDVFDLDFDQITVEG